MPSLAKVSDMMPTSFLSNLLRKYKEESPLSISTKRRRRKMGRLLAKRRRKNSTQKISTSRKYQSKIIQELRKFGKPLTNIESIITQTRRTRRRRN